MGQRHDQYKRRKPKRKTYPALVTLLAKSQHKIWAEWMSYLFKQGETKEDGEIVIPTDVVADAKKLIEAPWDDLTLEQQEAFQDEVKTIIEALQTYGNELIASMVSQPEGDEK